MPRPVPPSADNPLTPIEQRLIDELAMNKTVYFGDDPDNPVEGDKKLININDLVLGQRYESGSWSNRSTVIDDSMHTDRFVLMGLLRGFLNGSTSLIRPSRLSDTIVVGDATEKLRFSGVGTPIWTESVTGLTEIVAQPSGAEQITTDHLIFWTTPNEYEAVIKNRFYFNTDLSPSTVFLRWTAHTDPSKTDEFLVYESCSLFQFNQSIKRGETKYQVDCVDGMFDFTNKPLYLKDMGGKKMYYTGYFSEPVTMYGANVTIGEDTQFYPKNDQWQYKQEQRTLATREHLTRSIKNADFEAENMGFYLVDCTNGNCNVTITDEVHQFTIGDYDNTFSNTSSVFVHIGTDTFTLGTANVGKEYTFIRVGSTFRVYDTEGKFQQEGNV